MAGMRITRMELRDMGPFDDAALEFPEPTGNGEIVLFEGPNGCGKTTIAETIAGGVLGLQSHIFYPGNSRCRGQAWSCGIEVEDRGVTAKNLVNAQNLGNQRPERADERLPSVRGEGDRKAWSAFAYRGHFPTADSTAIGPRDIGAHPLDGALQFGESSRASAYLGQFLANMEFDRIQAKLYAAERRPHADVEAYEKIASARKSTIERFQHALSVIVGREVHIDFPIGNRAPQILFNGEEIPIALLGEGLRNTVSWLSDLIVRLERVPWIDGGKTPFEQDFWLILDEIEESLHPRMQARILPALRELFPNARIYATTHSPFVVASAGEGTVFRIQPDPKTGRISGKIEPLRLEPGQSLEWVVSEIFGAPAGFVDEKTQSSLEQHQKAILALRAKQTIEWEKFLAIRDFLLGLNDEVRTVVSMREVPVRALIAEKVRERAA